MIHINKTPKGLTVTTRSSFSADHDVLSSTTVQLFERRAGALKNIKAQMREFNSPWILVQDNTGKEPVILKIDAAGYVLVQRNAKPEINPAPKKKAAKKKAAKKK